MEPTPTGAPSRGLRAAAVLLGLAAAIWGVILMAVLVELGGTSTCGDASVLDDECFDGSGFAKGLTLALGWPSALAFVAVLPLAIRFAWRGGYGRVTVRVLGAALALGLATFVAARL